MDNNIEKAAINWYPGHMTKARRSMESDIRLIDLIIELRDARVPLSSMNPDIARLSRGRSRLVLLNKADLADPAVTDAWIRSMAAQGISAVALDSRKNSGMKPVEAAISEAVREKTERDRKRGILNRPTRIMIAGIPNVGKSTFINSFVKKSAAKTGNKPGVTKGNQWISLRKGVELLDTPGILWPKFDSPVTGVHLAMIGSINDNILDIYDLAVQAVTLLEEHYPGVLAEKYSAQISEDPHEAMTAIAAARNLIKKGQEPDTDRAATLLINDLRSGRLGRISLERPEAEDGKEA